MSVVEFDKSDGIATITLADVENRNALSSELLGELVDAMDDAEADPNVRVIVVTNRGSVFCAGANLNRASEYGGAGQELGPADVFGRFRGSPKPYVGRIDGHCVAGGMGLAAGMDIAVARDDVLFGFTEVRVGVVPALISVVCLPKMREADARSAMLRGNRFTAAQAQSMGLIAETAPEAELDRTVAAVVDDLLAGGPEALLHTKRMLAHLPTVDIDEGFRWAGELSAERFASAEAQAGVAAFMEKRPAPWHPDHESS